MSAREQILASAALRPVQLACANGPTTAVHLWVLTNHCEHWRISRPAEMQPSAQTSESQSMSRSLSHVAPQMLCWERSQVNGPQRRLPTVRQKDSTPSPEVAFSRSAHRNGPLDTIFTKFDCLFFAFPPPTAPFGSGKTIKRRSSWPAAEKGGDTSGLPIPAFMREVKFTTRHSARMCAASASDENPTDTLSAGVGGSDGRSLKSEHKLSTGVSGATVDGVASGELSSESGSSKPGGRFLPEPALAAPRRAGVGNSRPGAGSGTSPGGGASHAGLITGWVFNKFVSERPMAGRASESESTSGKTRASNEIAIGGEDLWDGEGCGADASHEWQYDAPC